MLLQMIVKGLLFRNHDLQMKYPPPLHPLTPFFHSQVTFIICTLSQGPEHLIRISHLRGVRVEYDCCPGLCSHVTWSRAFMTCTIWLVYRPYNDGRYTPFIPIPICTHSTLVACQLRVYLNSEGYISQTHFSFKYFITVTGVFHIYLHYCLNACIMLMATQGLH